ncbi:MAG: hypothetical protein GAK30_03113 [Paracidovorax wautersii]|uniref:Uncharacterized protein n=1 Tax=Paracidovorax wautersii TaxID=1177982 RepID=A0A7V8FLP8_9BURK|nr:MAG: hypothetical protein GAK30_03113 [Paracidovorax wautersii]
MIKSLVYPCLLAFCLGAYATTASADTTSTPLASSVTAQDRSKPLGWQDAPTTTSSVDTPVCNDAAYAKPEVHGVVSTGIATGSHMGTVTGEAGAVSLTKRLGDCGRPLGSIGVSVGAGRINGGGMRAPGF